jgi:hypothetical protein
MSRYQPPAKELPPGHINRNWPAHPIDLSERLLDDLSRLFFVESQALEREAMRHYTNGQWSRGARAELAAQGLEFDSREIAGVAFTKFRFRHAHEHRNLAPWERKEKPPEPF